MGKIYLPRWWILQYRSNQQGHKLISSVISISLHTCIDHLSTEAAAGVAGTAKALSALWVPKFCPLTHLCPSLTQLDSSRKRNKWILLKLYLFQLYLSSPSTWNSSYWTKTTNQDLAEAKQNQFGLMEGTGSDSWSSQQAAMSPLSDMAQHIAESRSCFQLLLSSQAWLRIPDFTTIKKNQLPCENWSRFC